MFAFVNGKAIPEYYGKPYVEISKEPFLGENKKIKKFSVKKDKIGSFKIGSEEYPIHSVYACIDREHISQKRNSGNKNKNMPKFFYKTYEFLKWKYLYNNCHLIAFQLSGDKSKENLIIGTRYMNEIGMQHFENEVKDYVKNTGNHVLYRVTPVFNENDQLIKGLQMEGYSLEDKGLGICFNVFIYNVQPGVFIYYENGDSEEDKEWCNKIFSKDVYTDEEKGMQEYILNIGTHKFHKSSCNCNKPNKIKTENKIIIKCPKRFLEYNGCEPCGNCKP